MPFMHLHMCYLGAQWVGPKAIFNALLKTEVVLLKLGTELRYFGCPNIT